MVQKTVYDGLGRTIQQTDPSGAITDTTYDSLGHIHTVSNPHFTSSSPSDGTTTFAYDALGRKTVQTQPDGSLHQWCYNGVLSGQSSFVCSPNASSKTAATWVDDSDETNRHYQRVSDALGRLIAVMEPVNNLPALETDYSYNALGDLLGVNQKGASGELPRTRSFTYDSLSRLITASNPETGTVCYGTLERWIAGSRNLPERLRRQWKYDQQDRCAGHHNELCLRCLESDDQQELGGSQRSTWIQLRLWL